MDATTDFYLAVALIICVGFAQIIRGLQASTESPPSPIEQLLEAFQAMSAQSNPENPEHGGLVGGLIIFFVLIVAFIR